MPIYEYQCQNCGNQTEVMQRMSDPPLETCEKCGGSLKKMISAPAFQFKGSGWYVTDYADKKKSSNDSGKGSSTSDGSSDDSKSSNSSESSKSESSSKDTKSSSKETSTKSASKD